MQLVKMNCNFRKVWPIIQRLNCRFERNLLYWRKKKKRLWRKEKSENWVVGVLVSHCLSSRLKLHWPHGQQRGWFLTPTFPCPFPWQPSLSCCSRNGLIGEPKETARLIGRVLGGPDTRETAVKCPLSFIALPLIRLLPLLLRWVEVQGAVVVVAVQGEIQGLCFAQLELHPHSQLYSCRQQSTWLSVNRVMIKYLILLFVVGNKA